MLASTQARAQQASANVRAKEKIADLQAFVARFSANASKARQATSRARQIEKIKVEDIKPSSRQNPYIRFEQEKQLHRRALEVEKLAFGYTDTPLFSNLNFALEAGEKLGVIGGNGLGKTTLMRLLMGELTAQKGRVRWAENANVGYFAQDHAADFDSDMNLLEWMSRWAKPGDDDQVIRGILGRLLFSGDDTKKSVRVLSGGEQGRMLYGKLMLGRHNVLVMDEPTNHMDMETIESLNLALDLFKGTLIFVSHDRQFVSSLATRIIELTPEGPEVYLGDYEEYLHAKGVD
jgi:ATPase subunit of ABC transporter with duplicated ATPase domains